MGYINFVHVIWILLNLVIFNIIKLSIAPIWWFIDALWSEFKLIIINSYKNKKLISKKDIFLLFNNSILCVCTKIKKTYNDINSYIDQIHSAILDINNYLNEVGWFLVSEWIGNKELKFKNTINDIIDIILNKENHSISVRLSLLYKKIKSLKLKTKIIITYALFLIIIRGATLSELPAYSILYILSKFDSRIELKVSNADIIWWKIKCFFIRNFTNRKEPENPADVRNKAMTEYINRNKGPSELEQRELDRLNMKNSDKSNNDNITFLDKPIEPIIEPEITKIELTEEEKLHKANEIESIIHQMFGKDNPNSIKTTITDDIIYEKFKWIFDLFDFF